MGLEHAIAPRRPVRPAGRAASAPSQRATGAGLPLFLGAGRGTGALVVQRDGEADLPPLPHFQLTPPLVLQSPRRPRFGLSPGLNFSLDPDTVALLRRYVLQALDPGLLLPVLRGVDWQEAIGAAPPTPLTSSSAAAPAAAPPQPGPGPEVPRAAAAGEAFSAFTQIPEVDRLLADAKERVGNDVERAWSEAGTGGQVVIVSWIGVTAGTLGTGAILSPGLRSEALNLIDGTVIPVPNLPWLGLEYTSEGGASFGAHVDLGLLLQSAAPVLGFGPAASMTPFYGPYDTPRGLFPDWARTVPGLQRESVDAAPPQGQDLSGRLRNVRGGGEPLPDDLRGRLERESGSELSGVRVHRDAGADSLARDLHARAFTLGSDVFFRRGLYDPRSNEGQRLLAHEVAHAVQQSRGEVSGRPIGPGLRVSEPNDPFEQQAERFAQGVVGGAARPRGQNRGRGSRAGVIAASRAGLADTVVQRDDSEEIGRRALADITAQTTARNIALLAQMDFNPFHPVAVQGAPAEAKTAREAFSAAVAKYEAAKAALTDARAHGATFEPAQDELPYPSEAWRDGFLESQVSAARTCADALHQGNDGNTARTADAHKGMRAYADALAAFRKRKAALRTKLRKAGLIDASSEIGPCAKPPSQTSHPTQVSAEHVEKIKKGEHFMAEPYLAAEGACTIGYGNVIWRPPCGSEKAAANPSKGCCSPSPRQVQVGTLTLSACDCQPSMSWTESYASARLADGLTAGAGWLKQHVLVDLDQAHFDALVDLCGHVGSIPTSLLDVIHRYACTDDERVRQEYLKTALYVAGKPGMGPVFGKRRAERVWPPQPKPD